MIEQSVSLASNGVVKVPGYEQMVRFGYTKNRGVYRLHVDATGEWEGLTIRAFWHVPDGKDPASSLVVDGYVDVPASVTAQPGNGCITFEGTDGTKTVTSADLRYRVNANSGTEDGTEPEPGTPAWQQLVDSVHTDATAAEQAKTDAQTAASEAATSAGSASQSAQEAADSLQELKDGIANGDFKGEKGDPGPAVALDTTLTHEGEAADAKATGDAISAVKVRQNILVGSETGNPLSVDDAFAAPLCGLTVYGKSTQDGTPTPDAPVPIASAGDGGSVAVKVTGRNILDMRNSRESINGAGITYTRNADYSFTRTGTATDKTGNLWLAGGFNAAPLPDGSNVFCTLKMGAKYSITGCVLFSKTQTGIKSAKGTNFTPTEDMYITGVHNEAFEIDKTYNDIVYPAVYVGAKALQYEPYREQLLTLPTPTGLPGIPVTSGGNYTDQSGQQWVCDEVDLERGVKVQRVKVKELSPDDAWAYRKLDSGNNNFQERILGEEAARSSLPSICNILPFKNVIWNDNVQNLPKIYANIQEITVSFPPSSEYSSLDAFKQLLTNVKSVIYYALATPIETPLTPAEIASYKVLTAYAPDTVVQAGDGAGVKLVYQRDVNIAIKRIEDAVASMT